MIRNILWVGLGGFLGSTLRYACYLIPVKSNSFWTTLSVNLIGSFIIGLIIALFNKGFVASEELRLFLTVGICGGFTTFSTFSMEMAQLSQHDKWLSLSLYLSLSVIGGIFAFIAGQKCV